MAEFVFKSKIKDSGLLVEADSKGTSNEEIGNPVYYAIRPYLDKLKIDYSKKRADRMKKSDGDYYDYIIVMETSNKNAVNRIIDEKNRYKVKRLLDFTPNPCDIADPWYTRDFDTCYEQINYGVDCFIKYLKQL